MEIKPRDFALPLQTLQNWAHHSDVNTLSTSLLRVGRGCWKTSSGPRALCSGTTCDRWLSSAHQRVQRNGCLLMTHCGVSFPLIHWNDLLLTNCVEKKLEGFFEVGGRWCVIKGEDVLVEMGCNWYIVLKSTILAWTKY